MPPNAPINDESRDLRYRLGSLCERYNVMVADKDTLDFRLGCPECYDPASPSVNPERVYEEESYTVSGNLRELIVEITEVATRIRTIERF